jgi:NAD(P)-dependent dehydrogenase (short-subunit alcohol dehydrogenase family)
LPQVYVHTNVKRVILMNVKNALITGANRGIGFEISRQLGKRGFRVFLTARNPEAGEKAARQLQEEGLDVWFIQLDVTDENSIEQAVKAVRKQVDQLDVLVNNAGIMIDKGNIVKMPIDALQQTLTTNVYGPIRIIQSILPLLPSGARIINMSSGLGSLSSMSRYSPAYSISKTMLNAVTRQFASVLADRNIAVNSVSPGWVRTAMGGQSAPRSVEKGAETVVWLATEAPGTLTGKFLQDKQEIDW